LRDQETPHKLIMRCNAKLQVFDERSDPVAKDWKRLATAHRRLQRSCLVGLLRRAVLLCGASWWLGRLGLIYCLVSDNIGIVQFITLIISAHYMPYTCVCSRSASDGNVSDTAANASW
jgi:hypothetical protein